MKIYSLILLMLVSIFSASTYAQKGGSDDGPVGVFDSGADYDSFMRGAKQAAYGENGSAELRAMIPMLNDMALNQPFGTTAGKYNTAEISELGLMSDPKVREEIGMVEEQYEEFQKMSADIQARAGKQLRGLDFKDREGLVRQIQKIQANSREEMESLFIPEQLERLQQLRNQAMMRGGRRTLVDVLVNQPVRGELEIDDEQEEKLREAEAEIQREIEEAIAKMREEAKERILAELNEEQREDVERMFGDAFEFAPLQNERNKGSGNSKAKWNKNSKK